MKFYEDLVANNPMTIEVLRFRRKYLSLRKGIASQSLLFIIGFIVIGLSVLSGEGRVSPMVVIFVLLLATGLGAPTLLSGSVAGERENRTWDLLLVAPVTKSQIVAGKYLGAMTILLAATAFAGGISLLALGLSRDSNFAEVFFGHLFVLSYGAFICAFTILVSARVRRPFTALGVVVGLQFLAFAVFPAIVGFMTMGFQEGSDVLNYLNPFYVVAQISAHHGPNRSFNSSFVTNPLFWGPLQTVIYSVLAVITVSWAISTLTFPENDVKFVPQPKNNA